MTKLRNLTGAVALTLVLGLSAFAGETSTPPCSPPEPGQMETPCIPPPSANQGVEPGTGASRAIAVNDSDFGVGNVAFSLLEIAFSLF